MSTLLQDPPQKEDSSPFDNIYSIKDYRKRFRSSDYYISRQGNTMLYYKKQTPPYQCDLKIKSYIIDTYSDSFEDDL